MSIQSFKQSLTGGGARANQFRVQLDFPTGVIVFGNARRQAEFLCNATSLPGSTIGVAPTYFRGREVKLFGERTFANWSMTIINDTDFAIRNTFEDWMQQINDGENNTGNTNPNDFTATMRVTQLDRNAPAGGGGTGNDVGLKQYEFVSAWPVNISDIALSFADNDKLEEFTVELAYAYWKTT